jgi:hypothetical protein
MRRKVTRDQLVALKRVVIRYRDVRPELSRRLESLFNILVDEYEGELNVE